MPNVDEDKTIIMTEYLLQNQHETFQMVWAKRFFVLSLVLLGIVFSLQGVGIIEFPVTSTESQKKKVKPVRVGGLLCQEPVWDFGLVDSVKNSRLSHEFILVNESKETVTIQKIHSTCGCMVAEDFDKELAPGKSTKIKVNVQLPPTPQLFHKNLAVQTNNGIVPLDVVGSIEVNNNLYSIPAKVNFGIVRSGETKERMALIFRYDSSSILNVRIKNNCKNIKCNINKIDDKTIGVKFSLTSVSLLSGTFEEHVMIEEPYDSLQPPLIIPIFAFVEEGELKN
jgi:hypothetical protein